MASYEYIIWPLDWRCYEIKEILSKFNLKFGMEIPGWPPENVEELAKKYEDPY